MTAVRKTVLVVDDEPAVLNMMSRVLSRYGYNVLEACSGEEARLIWAEHSQQIDFLLSDVVMPGINGLELADLLCQSKPDLKVLLVSGYLPGNLHNRFMLPHEFPLLQKPFSAHLLMDTISDLLGVKAERAIPADKLNSSSVSFVPPTTRPIDSAA